MLTAKVARFRGRQCVKLHLTRSVRGAMQIDEDRTNNEGRAERVFRSVALSRIAARNYVITILGLADVV